jgi:translation initiation factor 2 subunit 2
MEWVDKMDDNDKYLKSLDKALEKMPEKSVSAERFEEPKPEIMVFGRSKTMVANFADIAKKLNRDPQHILKFLSKELATKCNFDGQRVFFQGKFREEPITRLLHIYITNYVICTICHRPDTKVEKSGRYLSLVCEACGAKSPARPL